jgi:hypothetical protein
MPNPLQRALVSPSGRDRSCDCGRRRYPDALLTPTGSPAGMRAFDLATAEWVVLIGTGHPLAGIGPVAARALGGERIAVTGHRDGAAFDRAVVDVLTGAGRDSRPGTDRAMAGIACRDQGQRRPRLDDGPRGPPAGVIARMLGPRRTLSFELLWRDDVPSPALAAFVDAAAAHARPSRRPACWRRSREEPAR